MKNTGPPKAIRWQILVSAVFLAVIAILAGVIFATPLRGILTRTGALIGFAQQGGDGEALAVTDDSPKVQYYTCGMHPWVILPDPGDCPARARTSENCSLQACSTSRASA